MKIKSGDLVLEVGSGDKPYPRSDVLLDKFPQDSSEKEAEKGLVMDRPFVIGDVEALPFADKSFDYIICSHTLEHANNPVKFLDELSRVGRAGYIETPQPLRERVFDWPFHRWYVKRDRKKLVLIRKTSKSKKLYYGLNRKRIRRMYNGKGNKLTNLKFEWLGKINYEVFDSEPNRFIKGLDRELASYLKQKQPQARSIAQTLKNRLFPIKKEIEDRLEVRQRGKVDLFSLIVCPACKGDLRKLRTVLECRSCSKSYKLYKGKTPSFLDG